MEKNVSCEIGGRTLSIQTGKVAKQASGAAVVQYGDHPVVLVTVVGANDTRDVGFLPLTVEYQEKIYAAGRIPGNYFRREIGRPTEKETLTARLIDRPIRPLFPKGWQFETQVIATVLSMDRENDPDMLAPDRRLHRHGSCRTSPLPAPSLRCVSGASTGSWWPIRRSRTSTVRTSTSSWPARPPGW